MEMTLSPKELGVLADHMATVLGPRIEEVIKRILAAAARNTSSTQLTVKDVAEQLQVCEKTVLKHLANGKIAGANISSMDKPVWRISPQAVAKFLDNQTS